MDTPSEWRLPTVTPGIQFAAEEKPPTEQQSTTPVETAAFFLRNSEYPKGRLFHAEKPEHISFKPPVVIKRPIFPEKRQAALQMLEPCTLFVQYPCQQKCRSLGICIHFQFIAGCRRCPDGLRCPLCVQSDAEEAIAAGRKCPLHQEPAQANPIRSRPEDFLATRQQKEVYDHILQRSFSCFWHDLPFLPERKVEEERLLVRQTSFHRETTPRDLRDIQMIEAMNEDVEKAEGSETQIPGGSGPALYHAMHMGASMPQLEIRQSIEGNVCRNHTW